MAKPFRVKRSGKEIGNWKGRLPGGGIINLETKDATVARANLRRARAGDFGWQAEVADAVRDALDGGAESVGQEGEEVLNPGQAPVVGAVIPPSAPTASSAPAVAAAEGAAGADVPPTEDSAPDPVDEANAAAAEAAGNVADVLKQAAETVGIDLSELTKPETLGGLHVAGQSWLTQKLAGLLKLKEPPPLVVPDGLLPVVRALGEAWQKQLTAWNITVVDIPPGWAILGCSAIFAVVQFAALHEAATPAREGAASGVG